MWMGFIEAQVSLMRMKKMRMMSVKATVTGITSVVGFTHQIKQGLVGMPLVNIATQYHAIAPAYNNLADTAATAIIIELLRN
ncbi:hypothetical protein IWW34DRAFT_640354 [Fusarium oxysporum f. sp. albedinis]|nr:hypothetical protein IWW34DRAFT_640354 [Fusarium oxysporum f. sp. albedinis]